MDGAGRESRSGEKGGCSELWRARCNATDIRAGFFFFFPFLFFFAEMHNCIYRSTIEGPDTQAPEEAFSRELVEQRKTYRGARGGEWVSSFSYSGKGCL